MHKFRADLHIHTVLSPCASLEMSPENIVLESLKKKLQIIGITDHNSTKNCQAVLEIAKQFDLFVLTGVEITTREEVHCLAFFESQQELREFQHFLDDKLPVIENKEGKFGYQVVVDKEDQILEIEERLLISALDASINTIEMKVHDLNGIFIPAHVDKKVNSIFSQLAFIPPNLKVDALGITLFNNEEEVRSIFRIHDNLTLIQNSDAHYLKDIGLGKTAFFMTNPQFSEIKLALHKEKGRYITIK